MRAAIASVYGERENIITEDGGNILDGHHRKDIADELGVPCRVDVVQVADDEEARSVARMYNLARRHLTREQKRQLIADELQARPDRSDREIARMMRCDHKTVGSVCRELSGEFPHPGLTAAQQREAGMLFQVWQARTLDACHRISADEPIFGWTLHGPIDGIDLAVYAEASQRYTQWACTSEETRGILWADPDEDWLTP